METLGLIGVLAGNSALVFGIQKWFEGRLKLTYDKLLEKQKHDYTQIIELQKLQYTKIIEEQKHEYQKVIEDYKGQIGWKDYIRKEQYKLYVEFFKQVSITTDALATLVPDIEMVPNGETEEQTAKRLNDKFSFAAEEFRKFKTIVYNNRFIFDDDIYSKAFSLISANAGLFGIGRRHIHAELNKKKPNEHLPDPYLEMYEKATKAREDIIQLMVEVKTRLEMKYPTD